VKKLEFIKVRSGYLVKNSNGLIVSEDEMKDLESGVLSIKGATCEACRTDKPHKKTTATSKKEKKKKIVEEVIEEPINEEVEVVEDDSVEETSIII
jgi:hypothetical protein